MVKENQKYRSKQGLRFWAFVCVFLYHAGIINNYGKEFAACAVSLFFMISGFCNMVKCAGMESAFSLKNCFVFSVKKLKSFIRCIFCLKELVSWE